MATGSYTTEYRPVRVGFVVRDRRTEKTVYTKEDLR
jgi:hypothetical protein